MRFLSLPALLHSQIIQQLEAHDILNLSTCSSKINKIVKDSRVPLNCFEWKIVPGETCLKLRTWNQNVYFYFRNRLVFPKTMTLNGFEGYTSQGTLPSCWYFEGNTNSQLEKMSMFILDFFRVPIFSLTLNCEARFRNCFIWNLTQEFHDLSVTQRTPMSTEDLQFLLVEVQVKNQFILDAPRPAGPIPQLSHFKTHIRNSLWGFSSILNSNCTFLDCNMEPLAEEMNLLLREWIAGEILKNLVTLRFFFKDADIFRDQEVFQGAPRTRWTRRTKRRCFRTREGYQWQPHGYSNWLQYDIVRNDGVRATVAFSHSGIGFYVMDEEYKRRDGKKPDNECVE